MFVLAHHIVHYPFGIWQRVLHGPKFIWATPVSLHLAFLIIGVATFKGTNLTKGKGKKDYLEDHTFYILDICRRRGGRSLGSCRGVRVGNTASDPVFALFSSCFGVSFCPTVDR
jgi:hypothetical protein